MNKAAIPEPPPERNGGVNILEVLIAEATKRAEVGLAEYHMPLESNNGRNALKDARDESIDMSKYLCQAVIDYDMLLQAMTIAAAALDIAADWGVTDVQVNPPKEWELEAYSEEAKEGWCSTAELAQKLRKLALIKD